MKLTYKQRLFGIILLIFAVFAVCVIISERRQEKEYKTEALESKLDGYVQIIQSYISKQNLSESNISSVNKLVDILPADIRITVIKADGKVIYDKDVSDVNTLDNHSDRPEILKALYQDYGTTIRLSASTNQEYLYYAKFSQPYFVRVALPYDIHTQGLLKADNWFIYIVCILFVLVLILVNFVASRFSNSISRLRDFAVKVKDGKPLPVNPEFPEDELGEIGQDLVDIFKQKEKSKQDIELEKEKFILHFQYSEVGLSMFDTHFRKIFANSYFMQYLNLILDKPTFDVNSIFKEEAFLPIKNFLEEKDKGKYHSYQTEKNGKVFSIQVIIFDDNSFEITIKDITKVEKNRLLKQEMTNNIAHELRTPVTSLRGYLETLNEQNLTQERQKQFIDRAYHQSVRLSNLIDDVSLLSNIEETPKRYTMEKMNLSQLVEEVRIDLADKLKANNIKTSIDIAPDLLVDGNYTLLFSIFRNLMDNSISYAGPNIEIHIDNYMQDDNFVYLSYYDTGSGVEEEHLNRLFERFYRVHEGRTRDTGGSGLGLSIVRNAVLLHKGNIQVRNRENGGLEFLFTLKK